MNILNFFKSKKKLLKRRKPNRSLYGDAFNIGILVLVAAFMILPMVYAVSNAFKPLDELFIFPPRFFVTNPTLENFRGLFALMANSWVPFSRYMFNTFFITIVGAAGHVIIASMAAFIIEGLSDCPRKPKPIWLMLIL